MELSKIQWFITPRILSGRRSVACVLCIETFGLSPEIFTPDGMLMSIKHQNIKEME